MSAQPPHTPETAAPAPRRHRARRILAWTAGAIAVLLLALLAFVWWLLGTGGGRDFALARAAGALPPGALEVGRAEGPISGPMTLYDVRYEDGGILFTARRVHLEPALRQLFSRTLTLRRLEVEDAVLELTPGPEEEPGTPPQGWPELLPELDLPLSIRAEALEVDGLRVVQDGTPLVEVRSLTGALDITDGALHLADIALDSDRGRLRLDADYAPRENYRTRLDADLALPAHPGREPVTLALGAEGDLDRFALDVTGAAPGPVALDLDLVDGGTTRPQWTLHLEAPEFEPALFAPPPGSAAAAAPATPDVEPDTADAATPTPLDILLDARGTGGRAELSGHVAQGELAVEIAPSAVVYADGVIEAAPLALGLYEGTATLEGRVDLNPDVPTIDAVLRLAGLRYVGAEGEAVTLERGAFTVGGTAGAWTLAGDADLARAGDGAHLEIRGSGDAESARIGSVAAQTPTGDLTGAGTVRWSPTLAWDFEAALDGIDPGYFVPDFPGSLHGTLTTSGSQDDAGVLEARAELPDLGGTLRGHPLRAGLDVEWRDDQGQLDLDLALGDSRVRAEGGFGARLDLDLALQPLDLAELLPASAGTLRGTARITGTAEAPAVRADLTGQGLRYGDYRADSLTLRGDLPWQGRDGSLDVVAGGLDTGAIAFDQARVGIDGSLATPRVRAEAVGPTLAFDLAAELRQQASGWSGRVETLRLAPATGAAWSLQSPAAFAQQGERLRLDRSCLEPEGLGGSLCAQADWPRSAQVEGRDVPLSLLDPFLTRDRGAPMTAYGTLRIDADIAPAGSGWNGSVAVTSDGGGVRLRAQRGREVIGYDRFALQGRIQGQSLEATLELALSGGGRIDGRVATGLGADAPLDGQLTLAVEDLTFLELLSPDIASPSGRVQGTLALGGTLAAPQPSGRLELLEFAAELPALGIAPSEGHVVLVADPGGEMRIDGSVRSGEGTVRVDGGFRLDAPMETLVVAVQGENVTVANTDELRARASPDVSVRATEEALVVRGTVTVPYLRLDLESLESTTSPSSDVVVLDPVEETEEGTAAPLDIDLTLVMGEDVRLAGFGFDGKLDGTLRVRQEAGRDMLASGGLNVTGRYEAYGQDLTIERGRLGWAGSALDNPSLDVRATRTFDEQGITVGLAVRGTALQPTSEVFSDPAMDQSEALSYLVLGRPLRSASDDESQQLNAAAAALSAGSNLLAEKVGARLGLDEAGVSDSRALGGSALTVGKFISPRLYVSYGVSLLGTGQVLTFRYLLTKAFDIQIESGTIENKASINWRIEK